VAEVYAGLSGLTLNGEQFDLGQGIMIRKTLGHLMLPSVMAFAAAPPGQPHPPPWKTVEGGSGVDFYAELHIPESIGSNDLKMETLRAIAFLLRVGVNPATTVVAVATHSFSKFAAMGAKEGRVLAFEIKPRTFELRVLGGGELEHAGAAWVAERWKTARDLMKKSAEFDLAMSALDAGQYERNTALALVSMWGALEALFGGDRNELRFRVSSHIASYLIPYGQDRDKKQKAIAKLYDKRSAAVHGLPNHSNDDVLATFVLVREVIEKDCQSRGSPDAREA
jgi:hypothetical protein